MSTPFLLHTDTVLCHIPVMNTSSCEWTYTDDYNVICRKDLVGTPEYAAAIDYLTTRKVSQYRNDNGDFFCVYDESKHTYNDLVIYSYTVQPIQHPRANICITRTVHFNLPLFQDKYTSYSQIPYTAVSLFREFYNELHKVTHDILVPTKYTNTGFVCDIPVPYTLYVYQLENIAWMLRVEQKPKILYSAKGIVSIPGKSPQDNVYVDLINRRMYPSPVYRSHCVKNIRFCGGALLDDVGLGKTICVILTSLMNPCDDTDGFFSRHKVYEFPVTGYCHKLLKKTNTVCGGMVMNNTQIYCHRHITKAYTPSNDIVTSDFLITKPQNTKAKNALDVTLLKSKATVIFVPNQVTAQWEDAIKSHPYNIDPGKRNNLIVITITTKTQHDAITYLQLLTADFIIVSHNFLSNDSLTSTVSNFVSAGINVYKGSPQLSHAQIIMNMSYNNILHNESFIHNVAPYLGIIHYHRMVIDEVHEVPNNEFLESLYADYRWCLSGTPIATKPAEPPVNAYRPRYPIMRSERHSVSDQVRSTDYIAPFTSSDPKPVGRPVSSLAYLMKYLTKPKYRYTDCPQLDNYVYTNIIRRNTDMSTAHEKQIPPITECIFLIPLSHVERGLYDEYARTSGFQGEMVMSYNNGYRNSTSIIEQLREICSHPYMQAGFESATSLTDVNDMLITNNTKRITALEETIRKKTDKCNNMLTDISHVSSSGHIQGYLQDKVNELLSDISLAETNLRTAKMSLEYYKLACASVADTTDKECEICYAPLSGLIVGIANCGHTYCYDCVHRISRGGAGGPCAFCRAPITNIQKIDTSKIKTTDQTAPVSAVHPEYIRLQNLYGSKIAHVIMCMKHCILKNERIIVFSQWTRLLKKLEGILQTEGISYVSCRGNVNGKNSALRTFQHDTSVSVICLSCNNAASGSNLTCASVIMFLEPLYEQSKQKCMEIEEQANGRARRLGQKLPVKIYRFIIKDTLEPVLLDMYNNPDIVSDTVDCSSVTPEYLTYTTPPMTVL